MLEILTVPAITAIVNLVKGIGMPAKIAPLVAIFLGIAGYGFATGEWSPANISAGIILGLSASGLYDVTRNKNEPSNG